MTDLVIIQRPAAPDISSDVQKSSGWWGMLLTIATEAAIFAYLLFSYYYVAIEAHATWPTHAPSLKLALPNTFVLLLSSVTFWWAERQFATGRRFAARNWLLLTAALGLAFAIVQLLEWHSKTFSISSNPYGSLYFTITGFHFAHVAVGLLMTITLAGWLTLGLLGDRRNPAISIGAIYWHFVDAVWLAVFFTFYLTPYLS